MRIWIHVYDRRGWPMVGQVPTRCASVGKKKTCTASAFIKTGGDKVRVSFNAFGTSAIVSPGTTEMAESVAPSPSTLARCHLLRKDIDSRYFRRSEVDWPAARARGAAALGAPDDIDAVPHAISHLVSALPDRSHMSLYATAATGEPAAARSRARPTCEALGNAVWKLTLPETPSTSRQLAHYIRHAHDCLRGGGRTTWIVDLTTNGGGDAMAMFAALAPILGPGDQMGFRNPSQEIFLVHLGASSVTVAGATRHAWRRPVPYLKPESAFLISSGCASSCEALAMAVKGRFALLGRPTAGYTTANEALALSKDYSLSVTSGQMVDLQGKQHRTVVPDVQLSDREISDLLRTGVRTAPAHPR